MSHRRATAVRSLAALAVAAVVLGGCSNDKKDDKASSATTTTSAAGATTTTTTASGSGGSTTTAPGGGESGSTTTSAPPAGDSETPEGVIVLTITGGNVEGGVRRETVKQNSTVTIRTTSDVADELHVHGYDLKADLVPGQSTDLTFLAKIPGVFEVELEHRSKKVLDLEVRP